MALDQWVAMCQSEFRRLTAYGNDFLLLALVTAAVATLVSAAEKIAAVWRKPAPRLSNDEGPGSTIIDAIRNLIVALSAAPAWIAMFLAAALLLWMAPTRYGASCLTRSTQAR